MSLASRGQRDMGDGPTEMADDEAAVVRAQARRVHLRAGLTGLLVTIVAWLLP